MTTLSILIPIESPAEQPLAQWEELSALRLTGAAVCEVVAAVTAPDFDVERLRQRSVSTPAGPALRILRFARPADRGAALAAAIAASTGDLLVALEDSRQYDIADVARLVERLARFDLVCGCRRASFAVRALRRLRDLPRFLVLGSYVRDPDCLCWAARREAVSGLELSRGMERFLPALVARRGYRVGETHVVARRVPRLPSRGGWLDLVTAWGVRRQLRPNAVEELPAVSPSRSDTLRIDESHATATQRMRTNARSPSPHEQQ